MIDKSIDLRELLSRTDASSARALELFAILNLGLIEALGNGLIDADNALRCFYHVDNCLYIKKIIKNKVANEVMGRGVQLQDLFDILPAGQARREFLRELAKMRELCLKMLETQRSVA